MNIINKILSLLGNKNNRELSSNVLYSLIIKGFAMLVSILIVPAYVRYFSNDTAYGAWVTVSMVFTWITMFDFGIGNGLRNNLVKTIAHGDSEGSKKYISSAYISVGVISLLIWVAGAILIALVDWNTFLKVPADIVSLSVFKTYIQIVFAGVVIHFFFLLISSICYAIQRTFLPSLITLLTQIMLLVFISLPQGMAGLEEKILRLSWVYSVAYNLPILILTLILFLGKLKEMRPTIFGFNKACAKDIMSLGGKFFLIQLSLVALGSSNEIYINMLFAAEDVVQYNYYHKLFYIIIVFITLIQQPIWSAITKAYYEKRYLWIKNVWKIMWGIVLLCTFGNILLAILYQPISDIWLGKGVLTVDILSLVLFASYNTQSTVINTANCFANGFGKLKTQTIFTILGAIIKFPAAIFAAKLVGSWQAVMLATVIAQMPLTIVQPLVIHKHIKSLNKKEKIIDEKEN